MARVLFPELPRMSEWVYSRFRDDIQKNGFDPNVPVILDENGDIIDGRHRMEVAEELGIEAPTVTVAGLDETAKWDLAVRHKLNRAHVPPSQYREVIKAHLKRHPEISNREGARQLGVSKDTVGAVREELVQGGEIRHVVNKFTPHRTPDDEEWEAPNVPEDANHPGWCSWQLLFWYPLPAEDVRGRQDKLYLRESQPREGATAVIPLPMRPPRDEDELREWSRHIADGILQAIKANPPRTMDKMAQSWR